MDCSISKYYDSDWDSCPCHQGHLPPHPNQLTYLLIPRDEVGGVLGVWGVTGV